GSPSPQAVLQAPPAAGQTGSVRHRGLQPSPVSLLPSSHCSLPSTILLPQVVRVQGWPGVAQLQALPVMSSAGAGSSAQAAEQPSPPVGLPSSQVSPPPILPSPHF